MITFKGKDGKDGTLFALVMVKDGKQVEWQYRHDLTQDGYQAESPS